MKKLLSMAAFAIISTAATTEAYSQDWFMEGTQLIVPGGYGDFDEDEVIAFYLLNRHQDYQGPEAPHYVITDKKANAMFTIGGFVNFRTAYDFTSVMPNLDFIPAVIPMTMNISNQQRALMDASTSRLFFESIIKTRWGGPIKAYIETDFRGNGNTLRLRQAYVSYYGFKFGLATSTFTDINSAFNTIDFEGPNAFTYRRNLMAQFTHEWRSGVSVGAALEYPVVDARYSMNYTKPVYQHIPDVPIYFQYAWGESSNRSHIRASAVMRNMLYTDVTDNKNVNRIGWGAQLSGSFNIADVVRLYGQFMYGEGMAPYVQDLQGLPYDLVNSPSNNGGMVKLPVISYFAGAEFMLTPNMPLTVGYSQVTLMDKANSLEADDYYLGQYVVANCFYNFGTSLSVGAEYLYGTRHNVARDFGRSQRFQVAVQFNF